MKNRIRDLMITLYVILTPVRSFAQDLQAARDQLNGMDYSLGRAQTGTTQAPGDGLITALDDIISRLPFYLSALAFFAFLYSAGMYIFAVGDASKQEVAKKNMVWTATGMIAMALIAIIIRFAHFFATTATNITTTGPNNIPTIPGLTQ